MNELFATELIEQESPRLRWMRRHGLRIKWLPHYGRFEAWRTIDKHQAEKHHGSYATPRGLTEEEALVALAIVLKIKLWNEEDVL